MKKYLVTLKSGVDIKISAKNQGEAIKKAEQGKGKVVGTYFVTFRTNKVSEIK